MIAEETYSSLLYLSLECLGIKNVDCDHPASHLGKALGIVIFLRATPHHSSKRRCYLPLDLISKVCLLVWSSLLSACSPLQHGVIQEDLYRGHPGPEVKEVVYEVASRAMDHLRVARQFSSKVPSHAIPALLPSVGFFCVFAKKQGS